MTVSVLALASHAQVELRCAEPRPIGSGYEIGAGVGEPQKENDMNLKLVATVVAVLGTFFTQIGVGLAADKPKGSPPAVQKCGPGKTCGASEIKGESIDDKHKDTIEVISGPAPPPPPPPPPPPK